MKEEEEREKAGSLSKLLEMVRDREAWLAAVRWATEQQQLDSLKENETEPKR